MRVMMFVRDGFTRRHHLNEPVPHAGFDDGGIFRQQPLSRHRTPAIVPSLVGQHPFEIADRAIVIADSLEELNDLLRIVEGGAQERNDAKEFHLRFLAVLDPLEGNGEAFIGRGEVGEHPLAHRAALLHQVQTVDHRTEDRGVGTQELDFVLSEFSRFGVVDLEDSVGALAGHEDGHVDQRHHTRLLHEGRDIEPVLGRDVLGEYGFAQPNGVCLGGALVHRQTNPADDVPLPADPGAQEQFLPALLNFEDLGPARSQRLADEAAGFHQDVVEILRAKGKLAEICQHLLPLH